jgi:biopolymer transport protein ExbD
VQRALNFRPEAKDGKSITLNMTPLIDVLFLFIIFFMLTGTFKRVGELQLSLPEASTAKVSAQVEEARLELVATEEGELLLGGEAVELSALKAVLVTRLAASGDQGILVKAESGVTHGRVVELLDIVRDAGFGGVGIGTHTAVMGDSLR